MNAIELNNVTKNYKNFTLDNVSIAVPQGCILGLVGENGAGKTTMIKLLLGAAQKNSGQISVLGTSPSDAEFVEIKQQIGVVLAEDAFPEMITAAQINRFMEKVYRHWSSAEFERYCTRFDVAMHKKYKELSRGMKMKLSIAIALSHDAKLLILDEATSGLDPVVRDDVLDIFNDFTRDENHSVLMSSHITSDLEKICDYVAFIHEGRILLCSEKDDLLARYGIIHIGNGKLSELAEEALVGKKTTAYGTETLVLRDKVPTSLEIGAATLEDIIVYMVKKENGRN